MPRTASLKVIEAQAEVPESRKQVRDLERSRPPAEVADCGDEDERQEDGALRDLTAFGF
jgi:hypothetical protein